MWALITGSSSGIGKEFALAFAKEGYDIVLTARREELLQELAATIQTSYGRKTSIIPADLSKPNAAAQVFKALKGINIDLLVNNAGFGDWRCFADASRGKLLNMIQVNITTLTALSHLILPSMIQRRSGTILNVASVAAFQPGPYMAVYYATKAYVLSFSQALAAELKSSNILVSALCPGPTVSEFSNVAKERESGKGDDRAFPLFDRKNNPTAAALAHYTIRAIRKRKTLIIFNAPFRFLVFIQRFLPRKFVLYLSAKLLQYRM